MDLAGVRALFRYNQWANEQVLTAVSQVPVATFLHAVHPQPDGSIRGVLTHIVWSEWIWLQRWKGATDLVFQPADFAKVPRELVLSAEDYPTVEALRERFRTVGSETSDYVLTLTTDDLERVVTYRTPSAEAWLCVMWRQLVHTVNHSTYHRGQVTVMLRERGYQPRSSDFVGFLDAEL
jgi:uncharacterized damage-inducible protein DinB